MIEKSWTHTDKSGWGPGPWQDEPDKKQWADPFTGLPCLIKRNPLGALCGYVGVPDTHPWYRADYETLDVDVHGGLTYANLCMDDGDEAKTICHVPEPGEPDNVWWVGFDCSHDGTGDFSPAYVSCLAVVGGPPRSTGRTRPSPTSKPNARPWPGRPRQHGAVRND